MSGRRTTPKLLDRSTIISGRYRIDDCLAWGGMGVVYAATHVDLGHRVALKFLRPDLASDTEAIERFLEEARMAAGFRSEYVAHVLDYGHHDGIPFMVAELLEGVDLWTVLDDRGALSVSDAADWVAQACAGLAEVHAAGIVHRDLKPENLFLARLPDGSNRVKLLDFGVSKRVGAGRCLTKPKKGVGSPLYMSPEQMRGQEIDARADVWALGTVLYELLTGRLPFDAGSVSEICNRVLRSAPPRPSRFRAGLNPELEALILRCLEKDRSRRFADVAELARALTPFGRQDAARAAEEAERILNRSPDGQRVSVIRPRFASHVRALAGLAAMAGAAGIFLLKTPSTGLASTEIAPLTPPERALDRWMPEVEMRFAGARAVPEVERRRPRVRAMPRPEPPASATTIAETHAVVLTETEPAAASACPTPEPVAPPEPPLEATPVTPIRPAKPPTAGAWQI
jgi:serine/threonine-protein kinase